MDSINIFRDKESKNVQIKDIFGNIKNTLKEVSYVNIFILKKILLLYMRRYKIFEILKYNKKLQKKI